MTRFLFVSGLLALAWTSALPAEHHGWKDRLSQPDHEVAIRIDVRVPMRDGVELSADVYLPDQEGKWPVILERTPYGNGGNWYVERAMYFARRGYVYVIQDCRGRNDSDGKWYAWYPEIDDGRDTLDWCGTQPWSDGNVGMNGMSYMGLVQWMAAPTGSPYLKTIVPQMAPADYYLYGMNYTGGAFQLHINLPWAMANSSVTRQPTSHYDWDKLFRHLPILTADEEATGRPIDFYRDWVRHSSWDDYWKKIGNYGKFGEDGPAHSANRRLVGHPWRVPLRQLRRHSDRRNRTGEASSKGRHGALGPYRPAPAEVRHHRLRRGLGRRPLRTLAGVDGPLAEGDQERHRGGAAAEALRHGKEPVEGGGEVAAARDPVDALLSPQRRPCQHALRRRISRRRETGRGPARRFLRLRSRRPGPSRDRDPGRVSSSRRSPSHRAERRRVGLYQP